MDKVVIDCSSGETVLQPMDPVEAAEMRAAVAEQRALMTGAEQRLAALDRLRTKSSPLNPAEIAEAVNALLGRV